MTISSIGGGSSAWAGMLTGNVAGASSDPDGDGDGAAAGVRKGGPGVLKQLSSLAAADPTKFKQVAGDMAKSLRADAEKATGVSAELLNKFADALDQASQTGQLPALGAGAPNASGAARGPGATQQAAPPGASGVRHHHHHGGERIADDLRQALATALGVSGGATTDVASTTAAPETTSVSAMSG